MKTTNGTLLTLTLFSLATVGCAPHKDWKPEPTVSENGAIVTEKAPETLVEFLEKEEELVSQMEEKNLSFGTESNINNIDTLSLDADLANYYAASTSLRGDEKSYNEYMTAAVAARNLMQDQIGLLEKFKTFLGDFSQMIYTKNPDSASSLLKQNMARRATVLENIRVRKEVLKTIETDMQKNEDLYGKKS